MSRKIIHSAFLNDFRPLLWKGIPVYKRIEAIRGILKNRQGDPGFLFADPLVTEEANQNKESAYWLADEPGLSTAVNYAALPAPAQEEVLRQLKRSFDTIAAVAEDLKKSGNPEREELGEVLVMAMQIPSLDCIYAVNDRVLLVLWGFVNREESKWNFNISKLLEQIPPRPTEISQPLLIPAGPSVNPMQTPVEAKSPEVPVKPKPVDPPVKPPVKPPDPPVTPDPDPKPPKRLLWWILLPMLLLLALIAWWLYTHRHRSPPSYLPPYGNRVVPFDTTKIIRDPDSGIGQQVVSNRLNAQIDPNVPLNDFATRFKTKYPDDGEVKIIYYDTVFHTIQIEFYKQDLKYWFARLREMKECVRVYKESLISSQNTPSDPGFSDPRISYPYQITGVYGAWNKTYGDKYIVVAVIDNGFDLNHVELNSTRIYKPFSEITQSSDVSYGIFTENQHGTHVAALAVGNANNGNGASGFAPGCELMPIQIPLATNTISGISNAIVYAVKNGADVINMSLGVHLPDEIKKLSVAEQEYIINNNAELKEQAAIYEQMYQFANKFNCIIVAAAGNSPVLADLDPMKRSSLIINVGACDATVHKAPFSCFGKSVAVSAPGVQVYSAIPGNKYAFWDGTSMASPIVAGGVALMKSIKRSLNVTEAKEILEETGLPLISPGCDIGPLVQFDKAIDRLQNGKDACRDIADSLEKIIDSLQTRIRNQTSYFLIPPGVKDCSFARGDWYSSNELFNIDSHESVKLLFRFNGDCAGILFFIEKNKVCSARITMKVEDGIFKITQVSEAECDNKIDKYQMYYFECVPDQDGVAECKAFALESKHQVINFKLYKN